MGLRLLTFPTEVGASERSFGGRQRRSAVCSPRRSGVALMCRRSLRVRRPHTLCFAPDSPVRVCRGGGDPGIFMPPSAVDGTIVIDAAVKPDGDWFRPNSAATITVENPQKRTLVGPRTKTAWPNGGHPSQSRRQIVRADPSLCVANRRDRRGVTIWVVSFISLILAGWFWQAARTNMRSANSRFVTEDETRVAMGYVLWDPSTSV